MVDLFRLQFWVSSFGFVAWTFSAMCWSLRQLSLRSWLPKNYYTFSNYFKQVSDKANKVKSALFDRHTRLPVAYPSSYVQSAKDIKEKLQ